MRYVVLSLVLALAAVTAIGGCDSDDSGSGTIAQGSNTVPASGDVTLANVTATVPGTLQGTFTWTGAPTELVGAFFHVTPADTLGITHSPSPVVCTVAVTSARVAAGEAWQFRVYNSTASDATVEYAVTFVAD